MPITRATDIALRVLITLTGASKRRTIAQIAESIGVPERYTGKMVQRLSAEGWLDTTRGKGGGVRVSKAGLDATPLDVIHAIGEGWPTIDCADPPCPLLIRGCDLRSILANAEAAFMECMGNVTMAQLRAG
ncbi:MAG: Rrf2 family transcriptional regulator [Propionibacteriaceae bacterium]|nr:Rrf2 family transcriptional regulator [Propionibacteriaceae bacterium]